MNNQTEIKIPERLKNRPRHRGFVVPWFVAEIDGVFDFRVIERGAMAKALNHKLCWVCGKKLSNSYAFIIGPMCAINRVISEPPSHRECAEYSLKICPFLTQVQIKRNESNIPLDAQAPAGIGLKRQPGVAVLWLTKSFSIQKVFNGILFRIGEPTEVIWYRKGRMASRAEATKAIDEGLPVLMEMAEKEGAEAISSLTTQKNIALTLLPDKNGKMKRTASLASHARL